MSNVGLIMIIELLKVIVNTVLVHSEVGPLHENVGEEFSQGAI